MLFTFSFKCRFQKFHNSLLVVWRLLNEIDVSREMMTDGHHSQKIVSSFWKLYIFFFVFFYIRLGQLFS